MSAQQTAAIVDAAQMRARLALLGTPPASSAPSTTTVEPGRVRLRERVALLDYFDPRSVSDKSASPDDALNAFAAQDCELVVTREGSAWRLLLGVRTATLAAMGPSGALRSLSAPDAIRPADDDVTHRMARRLLLGERGLRELSPVELSGMLRAVEWLARLELDVPSEADLRAALDLANVLAPLRSVATADFVGREQELAMLRSQLFEPTRTPPIPLAIHGTGGVGKSTLLAKFVLERVEDESRPVLFSYLSFDRAELDPQFPLTLLGEMCRQLALQAPDLGPPLSLLRRDIDAVLVAAMALRDESVTSRGTSGRDSYRRLADEGLVVNHLAADLRQAGASAPILLVLDTFEVAQRRRRSSLRILDQMLEELRYNMPQLRIVIAGRAEVTEMRATNQPLGGLDVIQASALLRSALSGLGVRDDLIHEVVTQVSGNPLSLRLAADLMRREGPRVLATRRGRRRLLFDLKSEQVQGVLYRRILDHVAPPIRPLANPGLVVRQITPEVILQVLAEPCGLGQISADEAHRLFELLRADVSLVTEARPGVLVHRADVRREMLPLLDAEDHERVVDIHHRAIRYYQDRPEVDDQIEHLYHRLMLVESTATLDQQWNRGAGPFLEASMPELPPESRVYLAGKLNLEADPDDLRAADQTAWVRQATRQARALLDAGQPRRAWSLLTSAPTEPRDLAVSRLIVESLASQRRHDEALAVVRGAVADADQRGLAMDFVQLNILGGRVAEDAGAFGAAARFFNEAWESAQDLGLSTELLTGGVGLLRIERRGGLPAAPDVRVELIAKAVTLTDREKSTHPGLLRELAAELGSAVPGLLADASAHLGIEAEGESASHLDPALQAHLRETVNEGLRSGTEPSPLPPSYSEPAAPPFAPSDDGPPWPDLSDDGSSFYGPPDAEQAPISYEPSATSSAQGHAVSEALLSAPDDDQLADSLSRYWQLEADRASFDYDAEPDSSS